MLTISVSVPNNQSQCAVKASPTTAYTMLLLARNHCPRGVDGVAPVDTKSAYTNACPAFVQASKASPAGSSSGDQLLLEWIVSCFGRVAV